MPIGVRSNDAWLVAKHYIYVPLLCLRLALKGLCPPWRGSRCVFPLTRERYRAHLCGLVRERADRCLMVRPFSSPPCARGRLTVMGDYTVAFDRRCVRNRARQAVCWLSFK